VAAELVAVVRLSHVPDPPGAERVERWLELGAGLGQVEQRGGHRRRGLLAAH